jgi:GH25 family lysozyme M1 (1,4-beta-N-acetylmuramidase)
MKKIITYFLFFTLQLSLCQAQTILGIDVSEYQGAINWAKVKTTGCIFAYAKATQSTNYSDSYFLANMANGNSAGVIMGAYHYATPENDSAKDEATYFLSVAGSYIKSCKLPPVLDLEDPVSGPPLTTAFTSAALTAWVKEWMVTVYNATGISPILYTDGSIASYLNSSLNTYGLWMADPDGNPSTPPANIGVWKTWDFKQYSWTGAVSGISGNVDLDVFNGDSAAFNTLIQCNTVFANFTASPKTGCPGMNVTFTDLSSSPGTITGWHWTFTGGTPSSSILQNPVIKYSTPGSYSVKEVMYSTKGNDSITKTAYITVDSTLSLPLIESFQSITFPPPGWVLNLPNPADSVWELCTSTGYNSTQCMYFPANCGTKVNIAGERQQIYTSNYSFVGALNPAMWFDVAYEPYNKKYSDTLVVYYSLDCGNTWKSIYSKGGMTLCTTASTDSAGTDTSGGSGCFIPPNSKAWRTDTINLAALSGYTDVMFSFEDRSGWGNITYIDNINVQSLAPLSVTEIAENIHVKVYPNPFRQNITVDYTLPEEEPVSIYLTDVLGRRTPVYSANNEQAGEHKVNIGCSTLTKGLYILQFQALRSNNYVKVICQ